MYYFDPKAALGPLLKQTISGSPDGIENPLMSSIGHHDKIDKKSFRNKLRVFFTIIYIILNIGAALW